MYITIPILLIILIQFYNDNGCTGEGWTVNDINSSDIQTNRLIHYNSKKIDRDRGIQRICASQYIVFIESRCIDNVH